MKISFKFFCTAYLSVLLAVGAVGLFFCNLHHLHPFE